MMVKAVSSAGLRGIVALSTVIYILHIPSTCTEERILSKTQQSNKETKKQPAMTPKEKKKAKQAKKSSGGM
ncbi:hypothetical protein JKG47_05105 [Acidithiobacillus sp. MC6.1]|nr:hypothetical protein [Acidithiobacillus sp. MC6.1]